ncbi:MAG: glycosyltransferase family 1 protein [Fuerstiella sp.]|nr:glycosyltransferase family 1 protein [Fuerstiella sp.]
MTAANFEVVELPLSSRMVNLSTLLGHPLQLPVSDGADIYITADQELMPDKSVPRVIQVYDLSAINSPARSSLNWMGRRVRRIQARTHAQLDTHVVAISNFTNADLIRHDAAFEGRVTTSHIGIEDEWFRPAAPDADELIRRLGIPADYFCWWGAVSPRKNIDGIVRAYGLAKQQQVELPPFLIVGRVSQTGQRLFELADRLGVSDRIKVVEHQELAVLRNIVMRSQGVLFPSFYEGFGLPVVESLACGIPALASNIPALTEVSGGHAVLCEPESPDSILEGMRTLLKTTVNTVACREWTSQFTHAANARRYDQIIDTLT